MSALPKLSIDSCKPEHSRCRVMLVKDQPSTYASGSLIDTKEMVEADWELEASHGET